MLIPQFSLRWVLAVTAVCAVFSWILASAMRGSPWAIALSVGVASLAVTLAVHGAVFFQVWLCSLIVHERPTAAVAPPGSPFMGGSPLTGGSTAPAGSPIATGSPFQTAEIQGGQDGKPRT